MERGLREGGGKGRESDRGWGRMGEDGVEGEGGGREREEEEERKKEK